MVCWGVDSESSCSALHLASCSSFSAATARCMGASVCAPAGQHRIVISSADGKSQHVVAACMEVRPIDRVRGSCMHLPMLVQDVVQLRDGTCQPDAARAVTAKVLTEFRGDLRVGPGDPSAGQRRHRAGAWSRRVCDRPEQWCRGLTRAAGPLTLIGILMHECLLPAPRIERERTAFTQRRICEICRKKNEARVGSLEPRVRQDHLTCKAY